MSDTAPDTGTEPEAPPTPSAPAAATSDMDALVKDVEKWKAHAQKHEKLWKDVENSDAAKLKRELAASRKEIEALQRAGMTEQEKVVAEAVAAARTETLKAVGARLVDAEVRAAAAGRDLDIDALLEGLDRSRFLDDDGEPKVDDIVGWVNRLSPAPDPNGTPRVPDLGQGARGKPAAAATGLGNDDDLTRALKHAVGIR